MIKEHKNRNAVVGSFRLLILVCMCGAGVRIKSRLTDTDKYF
nr:unnamed protein product [Callosobruchus chinensis]